VNKFTGVGQPKIRLTDILNYLPHGLKCVDIDSGKTHIITGFDIDRITPDIKYVWIKCRGSVVILLDEINIILRENTVESGKMSIYDQYKGLYDCKGLIEKGLAVRGGYGKD